MPAQKKGLTSEEAKKRLGEFGPNVLPEKPPPGDFDIFIAQFKNPLVYVLLSASLVTLFLGKIGDTVIILTAVFINTILGFWQERRANRALTALKKLISPIAIVIRDGEQRQIPLSEVVPGDIAVLSEGIRVPGDGEIIEGKTLYINEAILTGESEPAEKKTGNEASLGTIVVSGRGLMVVQKTGEDTQMGKIASEVGGQIGETPLQKQLHSLAQKLAILVGLLTLGVFALGMTAGETIFDMFLTSVALAVSAIPEGLLVSTTAVLALGMTRILKRQGLVRRLLAAETLGGITVICTDKTGTLTQGEMRVVKVDGEEESLSLCAVLCNNFQDPLEVGMFEWVPRATRDKVLEEYSRLDDVPFSSRHRYAAFLYRKKKERIVLLSGAPEMILEFCNVSKKEKDEWRRKIDEYGNLGFRLVGFARRQALKGETNLRYATSAARFSFVGLILFADPVRPSVKEALREAESAGIQVKVITGDYPGTAIAVLRELGREPARNEILLGSEMITMSEEELYARIPDVTLFARTTPEQKLQIVEALKKRGEIVAMTGDGVNDAPALARSDIGVVVGSASDVAREGSDLVLLDSNFETIVAAIEEGRGIFDNLRKIVLYLLSDAFGEITAVVGTILLRLPLPLTAVQILWINIVSDSFPNLALTIDPKRRGLMNEPPRSPLEPIVTRQMGLLLALISVVSGIMGLLVFVFFWTTTANLELSRSVAFLTLGVNSLFYVFSVRNLRDPIWLGNLFNNRWLIVAVVAGFVLQSLPFYVPVLREFFGVVALGVVEWGIACLSGIFVLTIIEIFKLVFFKKWQSR